MKHNMSNEEGIAEAPDLGSFRPVFYASKSLAQQPAMKSNGGEDALVDLADLNAQYTRSDNYNIEGITKTTQQESDQQA
jgi:hypothetical protein